MPSASSESSVGTCRTVPNVTGEQLSPSKTESGSLWLSQFHSLGHTSLQFACNFLPQPQHKTKTPCGQVKLQARSLHKANVTEHPTHLLPTMKPLAVKSKIPQMEGSSGEMSRDLQA